MTTEEIQRDMRWLCRRTTTPEAVQRDYEEGLTLLKADGALWSFDGPHAYIDFYRFKLPEYVI